LPQTFAWEKTREEYTARILHEDDEANTVGIITAMASTFPASSH
jgi:hypothetical protein